MLTLLIANLAFAEINLKAALLTLLYAVVILGIVVCLIYCIERWIAPIPAPGKTVIAIVLVLCVLIWAVTNFL